ncbi:tRNA-splicing endonuclease subunit Sen34 [Elysia marginata]|uniref:tRNA-splicing endonuclease subunit SEN34 n=1 Tax=Elysia marginata TaxID=1093978 RepID=A0AAV4G834_9GAST|nr:tRNA-splicing endonuclease subunit Sen34 [Elysia marginata]
MAGLQEIGLSKTGTSNAAADDDELLLLSSPSPPTAPDDPVRSKRPKSAATQRRKAKKPLEAQEVVNLEDDLDLEIVEEVTSIPGASFSASASESTSESGSSEEDLDLENDDDEPTSLEGGKMNILYSHGSFFLWDAEDVHMLREECRIVGKLVGCLPRAPRQNIQLGLPLQLMPEEVKLLVDIKAAAVVVEKPVSETLTNTRKAAFENVRQQNFQIQEHRKEEVSQRMDSIIAGKKAKKRKLQEETNKNKETSESLTESSVGEEKTSSESTSTDENTEKDKDEDIDGLTVDDIVTTETSEEHSLVQLFTQNPWKQNLVPVRDWAYPSSERDMLRYLVFKDLWGKGFYLTSGAKFGGDFLVYPGDPSRYHSHYIAVCRSQFDEIPCLDLVSLGRLSSNVRKTALLCALDRNRKVTYTSLTWTGIS